MKRHLKKDLLHGQLSFDLNSRAAPTWVEGFFPAPTCLSGCLSVSALTCPVQLYHLEDFKLKIGIWFLRLDTSCWADNGTHGHLCVGSAGAAGVRVPTSDYLDLAQRAVVYNGSSKKFSRFFLDCQKVPPHPDSPSAQGFSSGRQLCIF